MDTQAPPEPERPRRRVAAPARHVGRAFHRVVRILFDIAFVILLVGGLAYLRLSEGPLHLPTVARWVENLINASAETVRVELGDIILTLARDGRPGGLQFVDVRITSRQGQELFEVPLAKAEFDPLELVRGRVRPREITIIGPRARLLRTADGRLIFGLEREPGTAAVPEDGAGGATPAPAPAVGAPDVDRLAGQYAAVKRVLDGLVGDAPPVPELARLEEVAIIDAVFEYESGVSGRRFRTDGAWIVVRSTGEGVAGELRVGVRARAGRAGRLRLAAERRRGSGGAVALDLSFGGLRPGFVADELPALAWLGLFDAALRGRLAGTVDGEGRIARLEGRIAAGPGRILGTGERGEPFRHAEVAFAYDPDLVRMKVSRLRVEAPRLTAEAAGLVELRRDASGAVGGLGGQFELRPMTVDVPDLFADPLTFDGGQIVAEINLAPLRIDVRRSFLEAGALVVEVDGSAVRDDGSWTVAMRAAGRDGTVADLVRFWPLEAAGNARRWVENNIHTGSIDAFLAQLRFAGGRPELALDFAFSGLESSYLGDMSPIVAARGRGSLSLERFALTLESGEVHPAVGGPVRLDGSEMVIPDLRAKPTLAEIALRGKGATAAVLTLIDEPPLRLVRKLDLDPAGVEGTAEVEAALTVPLVRDVSLGDLEVSARARLADVRLPFRLPYGPVLDVAGEEAWVEATTEELAVRGSLSLNGRPVEIEWHEHFARGRNQRSIAVRGRVTPEFLRGIELATPYFAAGEAAARLDLEQTGSPDLRFRLAADLADARLEVAEFDWAKPPGPPGHLEATGIIRGGVGVEAFRLESEELKSEGAMTFDGGGRLTGADIRRLRFRGLADVALRAARRGEGFALEVGGRFVDLALFDDAEGGGTGAGAGDAPLPLDVRFDLERMVVVAPEFVAEPAAGTFRREATGAAEGRLEGRLKGAVPFVADYRRTPGEAPEVVIESGDGGAFLRAAGLFPGARGGALRIRARLEEGGTIAGTLRLRDVTVQSAGTLRAMLSEGGVDEAAKAAEKGGLYFDRVRVHFVRRREALEIEDAVATGNMLAITAAGRIDHARGEVELTGVISPAYGLTGALDNVPLLGALLSGGRGEGILAMTFSLSGPLENPRFAVNPLSLLTPGVLRKVFSGKAGVPSERFLENLKRDMN